MGGALKKGGYGYECGKTFCRKTARACVRLRLEARRNKRALRRRSVETALLAVAALHLSSLLAFVFAGVGGGKLSDPPARKSARFLKAAFVSQRTARNKNIYAQTHGQTWRGFFLLQLDEKRLLARRLQSASVVGRFPLHARLPARQRGLKAGLKAATQKTANLKTTKKRAFSHGILKLV